MSLRKTIIAGLLLLFSVAVLARPQRDTVRILAIGNSFSQDAVEQNLYELAKADGIVRYERLGKFRKQVSVYAETEA